MRSDAEFHCRVCGLRQEESPWGEDGRTPTFEICDCCGVEFGYEGAIVHAAKVYRHEWLQKRAPWSRPKARPATWDLEHQLESVPNDFR